MIVTIQAHGSKVSLSRHSLRVLSPDGTTTRVPLAEIDRLILGSRVAITPCGLGALLGKSIPVAMIAQSGQHLGSFEPPSPPRGLTRRLLYRATGDETFVRRIAALIVSAKVTNARRALQRLNSRRPAFDKHILTQFSHLLRQLEQADTLETEQYEDRLTKPFNDLQSGCRTTFRALLAQAPLDFKMALADPSRFAPFLLQ